MGLSGLVREGFLESRGVGKRTYYVFPGESIEPEEDFLTGRSEHSGIRSEHLEPNSEHSSVSVEYREVELIKITEPIKNRSRVPKQVLRAAILAICATEHVSLKDLADLLGRKPDYLRVHFLSEMVGCGDLEMKFAGQLHHPGQAYRAKQQL